jgi:hypothetical protein
MVFTLICVAFGFTVREAAHISGAKNWKADKLSRLQVSASVELAMKSIGCGDAPAIDVQGNPFARVLLGCCNPTRAMKCESEFNSFWCEIWDALRGLGGHRQEAGWAMRC